MKKIEVKVNNQSCEQFHEQSCKQFHQAADTDFVSD